MTDKEAQIKLAIMQSKMMITDDRRPALIRGLNAIKNKVAQQAEIEALKAQLSDANREASSLAMFLYNSYYKDDSIGFELCDTPAGIITQIDNMVAGMSPNLGGE